MAPLQMGAAVAASAAAAAAAGTQEDMVVVASAWVAAVASAFSDRPYWAACLGNLVDLLPSSVAAVTCCTPVASSGGRQVPSAAAAYLDAGASSPDCHAFVAHTCQDACPDVPFAAAGPSSCPDACQNVVPCSEDACLPVPWASWLPVAYQPCLLLAHLW